MARPKSDNKRNAILAAASEVVAEQGLGAATARIAKTAGVAEGTLFTYFPNKDQLLNELYLELKAEAAQATICALPRTHNARNKLHHCWEQYVRWGVANPHKRKVLAQLALSARITPQTRAAGSGAFTEAHTLLEESSTGATLREPSPAFVGAIMAALAETTLDFIAKDPERADEYAASGFEAFWNATAR